MNHTITPLFHVEQRTATDQVLYRLITWFVTKDEWHTIILGFFDGLSFTDRSRYVRKALTHPDINLEGIDTEKIWYYQAPYVIGEFTKLAAAAVLLNQV